MRRINWEVIFVYGGYLVFLILMTLAFTSCGRKQWQNRGERNGWIETKADTILTETVEKDTIFDWRTVKDTVILRQDKLTVKYFHTDSLVYLSGKCDPDTLVIEKQTVKLENKTGFYELNFWGWALILLCAFAIWRKFKK